MSQLTMVMQGSGLTGTAAEIAAALSETVELPYCTDLWSYNGVALLYGTVAAEGFGAAIKAAGLEVAYLRYAGMGFDLSEGETQSALDLLATLTPQFAAMCAALKAIGRPQKPRWDYIGLPYNPSINEIQLALDVIASTPAPVLDQRQILLSVNYSTNRPAAAAVCVQATSSAGVAGDVLLRVGCADIESAANLTEAQQSLLTAVKTALDVFAESL